MKKVLLTFMAVGTMASCTDLDDQFESTIAALAEVNEELDDILNGLEAQVASMTLSVQTLSLDLALLEDSLYDHVAQLQVLREAIDQVNADLEDAATVEDVEALQALVDAVADSIEKLKIEDTDGDGVPNYIDDDDDGDGVKDADDDYPLDAGRD